MPEVPRGCGVRESGWDHSCSVVCLIACSEYYDQRFVNNDKSFKDFENRQKFEAQLSRA